tara:strand:+ start:4911 stop:5081 length:171 start_codon:yes stop_codon:yes gene_type:complete
MPLIMDGVELENGYCIDILVERKLVLELKAEERTTDFHFAHTQLPQTWKFQIRALN